METKIATCNQRKSPEHRTGDRLSSLPDEILSHILSFLKTKYAVGTAVLSRRWKDLWTRVSNLDLDYRLFYHYPTPNNNGASWWEQISEVRGRRELGFARFVDGGSQPAQESQFGKPFPLTRDVRFIV
ncbi:unnamed protein product [Linum trigynum]|uniref:F-box domain-containing protein n=1 Tax=Linum trigynum TaxID=586398 RepID=A0AAV2FHJ5_9ROSI